LVRRGHDVGAARRGKAKDSSEAFTFPTAWSWQNDPIALDTQLLRKAIKQYGGAPRKVDALTYKDLLRHANKHGLISEDEVKRWFVYRENRNSTAHDYGKGFAEEALQLMPGFLADVRRLEATLAKRLGGPDA
jgi:hypothetical protein